MKALFLQSQQKPPLLPPELLYPWYSSSPSSLPGDHTPSEAPKKTPSRSGGSTRSRKPTKAGAVGGRTKAAKLLSSGQYGAGGDKSSLKRKYPSNPNSIQSSAKEGSISSSADYGPMFSPANDGSISPMEPKIKTNRTFDFGSGQYRSLNIAELKWPPSDCSMYPI
ncbi:hypothetical protein WDU94_007416 [Cyamophila willieti]